MVSAVGAAPEQQSGFTWGGALKGIVKIAAVVAVGFSIYVGAAMGFDALGASETATKMLGTGAAVGASIAEIPQNFVDNAGEALKNLGNYINGIFTSDTAEAAKAGVTDAAQRVQAGVTDAAQTVGTAAANAADTARDAAVNTADTLTTRAGDVWNSALERVGLGEVTTIGPNLDAVQIADLTPVQLEEVAGSYSKAVELIQGLNSESLAELKAALATANVPDPQGFLDKFYTAAEQLTALDTALATTDPQAAADQLKNLHTFQSAVSQFDKTIESAVAAAQAAAENGTITPEVAANVATAAANVTSQTADIGHATVNAIGEWNSAVSPGYSTLALAGTGVAGAAGAGAVGYWAGKVGGKREMADNFRDAVRQQQAMAEAFNSRGA